MATPEGVLRRLPYNISLIRGEQVIKNRDCEGLSRSPLGNFPLTRREHANILFVQAFLRYCKRCKQRRQVNWRTPGTLSYCTTCLGAVARQEPTQAQREAKARKEAKKKQRVAEVLAWVDDFKSSRGCASCGETDPRALDCHHKEPAAKEINISALIRRKPDLLVVSKELAKCSILCASCHRKEHHNSREPFMKSLSAQPELEALLKAIPGSVAAMELRRTSLVATLSSIASSLTALRSTLTPAVAEQCYTLERRRRSLSVSLMKLDAEIAKIADK